MLIVTNVTPQKVIESEKSGPSQFFWSEIAVSQVEIYPV